MTGEWRQDEARAKVNLRLRIFPRAADGFHPLETVFCRIDLADRVRVRLRRQPGVSIRVHGPEMAPRGPENLAARAAALLLERVGAVAGAEIELEKRVPPGSGLGGGSSDAATVLRLLADLLGLGAAELPLEVAPRLGADVAFFLVDVPLALAWGRGDRLLPCPGLAPRPMLLLLPPTRVASADAYADWDRARESSPAPEGMGAAVLSRSALTSWSGLRSLALNDFEPVIFRRHPELRSLRERLDETGPSFALLCGSGSALFAVYPSERERDEAGARLREDLAGVRVVSARGPV